jgi:hypothetical protein
MLQFLIFAAHSEAAPTGKGMNIEWGIILLGLILGLIVTLMPPKRTYEFKREKDED